MQLNQTTQSIPFASTVAKPTDLRMVGTVETVDGKFLIRSPYNAKALSFLQSLPHSQWLKAQSAWKCDATPYAAWKLGSVGLSLDIPAKFLCDRWEEGQLPPQVGDLAGLLMTFKTTPWRHQQRAMAFALKKPAAMLALEMGCLAGDTLLSVNKAGNTKKITIADLFSRFNHKRRVEPYQIRCLKDGLFGLHPIKDVVQSGVKNLVKVTLDDGKFIKCTSDHQLCIWNGDTNLYVSAGSISIGFEVVVNGKSVCRDCGSDVYVPPSRKDVWKGRCKKCADSDRKGDKNPKWKGGRFVDGDGYVRVKKDGHHRAWANGYVYEHILVMEEKVGRPVTIEEHVHHRNGIRNDNHPDNLELLTPSEHNVIHDRVRNLDGGSTINGGEVVFVPKRAKVVSVEDCGEEMTYDIKMESPYHNFVANGIVVHNCGKTLTTICLLQAWQARMNLIICPKSVTGVWRREFGKHCGVSHQVVILEGSSKQKAAMLEQGKLKARSYGLNAFVINYESSWREFIGEALQSTMWDCVVCDESHRIKEMSSNQSKFAATLSTVSHRRLALTGTVMPRGAPIEVLGQYRFLEPALFGTKKSSFQDKFCNMSSKIPNKVDSYKNQEEFTETFSKIAFRIKSADVLTLPDIQQITIPVTLESKTRNYYEKMKKECIVELESGAVTAKNAAIKVMRLHQIACGHSKTEEGEIVRLGTEKQEVLLDMIEDIAENEPVVVFCKFIEDLRQIESVATKLGRVYGEISGSRKDLTPNATMPENIQVMGVQVKAGGTGLDLTRARYAFWFSACDTWGDFDQANARIHRPGQTRPVVIYHLAATATVDIKIYRSLRNQQDIGLELLKSIDRPDDEL